MNKRNILGLSDRFAKYAKTICIRVNVSELKKDTTYTGKVLFKLLNSKIKDFSSHIKYCETSLEQLTNEEKSFLARVALIGGNSFLFQLGSTK